jgi:predicted peroxiredoxin
MKTLLISGSILGRDSDEIGAVLMEKFLTLMAQSDRLPETIFFFNTGVLLSTDTSPVLPYLKSLRGRGVRLLACGTCLDYFKIRPTEGIEASTMIAMVELLNQGDVVTL